MAYDLVGQRFGKLTVTRLVGSKPSVGRLWQCKCDCGGERVASSNKLLFGRATACGCTWGNATHGHTWPRRSPTYKSWQSMVARCTQPSNPAYAYYRALGVRLCKRWRDFVNFLADMGERPSMAHTIDRYPNNRGNYEPDNCRWATRGEQAENRVTTKLHSYKGTQVTLPELARLTGLPYDLLRHRIVRAGWAVEEAMDTHRYQGQRVKRLGKR